MLPPVAMGVEGLAKLKSIQLLQSYLLQCLLIHSGTQPMSGILMVSFVKPKAALSLYRKYTLQGSKVSPMLFLDSYPFIITKHLYSSICLRMYTKSPHYHLHFYFARSMRIRLIINKHCIENERWLRWNNFEAILKMVGICNEEDADVVLP